MDGSDMSDDRDIGDVSGTFFIALDSEEIDFFVNHCL
jgi:hypothetical protein